MPDLLVHEPVRPRAKSRRRTRIQEENEARILAGALTVFSAKSFNGATLDEIAEATGLSKSNILYYFAGKEDIYRTLLSRTLNDWLEPLRALGSGPDPVEDIRAYIRRKFEMARAHPEESRLFASEILHGAPVIHGVLAGALRDLVEQKTAVIRQWIDDGLLVDHDPTYLIFAVWALTQHYADFDAQVRAVMGLPEGEDRHFETASGFVEDLLLKGLLPR